MYIIFIHTHARTHTHTCTHARTHAHTQVYDAKKGTFVELGVLDVMQIFGRAGRPQFDSSGEGIIITTHDKLNHYLHLMHNALPIESKFLPALTDHLNAEVVLGTVSNTAEAVAWLTYTYCYVRMLRNPMHYGVAYHELQGDPRLQTRCRELIEISVKELAKAKMLRFNFETTNMNTTDTGIVASHFYVKYASLELYNELVHPAMSEADCFEVVARSSEFENVQARDEENQELVKLLTNACPVKIKTQAIEGEGIVIDQIAKVNILLQAYISKAEVDGFALVADMNHVVQSAGRIFRALFELCVKKGFVSLANKLLTLNKVVTQRVWPHQHALRQFGHVVPAEWCYRLEQKNLSLDRLWEMSHQEVSALIRQNNSGLMIQKFVGMFPWLDIKVQIQPITRTILRVTLNIKADFEWSDRVSGTVEPFWVWVEDNENERIYHTEYFLLHKKQLRETHVLAFTVPLFEPLQGQYVVRAISDRWLHAEHCETIDLRDLVLPEKYPAHTTLLKLCPLPKEALQNEEFQAMYKFSHFNAVQTQVFHTLRHTDVCMHVCMYVCMYV
jgi:activating signal cointegrator complex subunit 3